MIIMKKYYAYCVAQMSNFATPDYTDDTDNDTVTLIILSWYSRLVNYASTPRFIIKE